MFARALRIGAAVLVAVVAAFTPAQAALPGTVQYWTTVSDPTPRSIAYCTQYGGAALNSQVPGAAITQLANGIVLFTSGDARTSATLWCIPVGNGMLVTLEVRTSDSTVNFYAVEQAIANAFWNPAASGPGRYLGCYTDSNSRDLPAQATGSSYSNESCIAACAAAGYSFAGTQYAGQCFCGNSYGQYGAANTCNMACTAAPSEVCGGYYANSVYAAR